jgi:hypothetical protein
MSASFALAGWRRWARAAAGRRKNSNRSASSRKITLRRAAIFCDGHAHAHRRDSAGRQILRRPAGQNRRQRAVPGGNGGTDRYAQASILDLYDPDRARHFKQDGKTVSRDEALKFLDDLSQKFAANQGEGLAFLAESSTSPSRARLQKIIAQKFPKSQWFTYDAIDSGIHQRAATQAFGQPVRPVFHFDKAKVILSLDCDFLGGEDDAHNHIRKFAAGRKPARG